MHMLHSMQTTTKSGEMQQMIGRIMNVEANGQLIVRGRIEEVHGHWVLVREHNGLAYEWPIGEMYQLVEC